MFCPELFVLRFFSRNAYSTLINTHPHSPTLFSHFASTRFNISDTHINRMCKWAPSLQRLQTLDKVEQFVDLLNRHGCSDLQIAKIMISHPSITITSTEILEPKIKLLEEFGLQGETLSKLLVRNPCVLAVSLKNDLLPKMEFLKNLFQSQQFFIKFIHTPLILGYNLEKIIKPSIVFWQSWGFRGKELLRLILINPAILQRTSLTSAQADLIQEIGADKKSNQYKYIVSRVATSRVETLRDKIDNLRLCGLSAEETLQLCRAKNQVFCYSKVRITETMKFVVEDMGFPPNYTVKNTSLFDINLEKVRPRFLIWQKIKSMNGPSPSLLSILKMTEVMFVKNIIRGHPESTALWTIYEDAISNASNHTKSSLQF